MHAAVGAPPQAAEPGMAALVRGKDWSQTPLGPMEGWPRSLRTIVDVLLANPLPMVVRWGPQLIQIYNDAYRVVAADRHPEALGQPTRDCWPEAWPINEPIYRRALGGESVHLEDRPYVVTRYGRPEQAYFTVAYCPVLDDAGRVGGVLVTVLETTQKVLAERERSRADAALREAKEAAEAANRAKDQFLAVLSHELRTPLTPVLATVQMLEADPGLTQALREPMTMIRRNVELEARLIDDLLDVTRIARGKLALHFATVDAGDKLRHVLESCRCDLSAKQLELAVELNAADCCVRADPARLQQVFWNLLKNAIKFTPRGGRVTVRTYDRFDVPGEKDGRWVLEVRDSGVGMDSDTLGRIFAAFEQGGRDVTRQFGGLGLGLAISKGIVDMHGGTLAAHSDGKGRGSTFTVSLPRSPASARPAPDPEPGQTPSRAGGVLRVLLVEDHADTARVIGRLLTRLGYQVRTADSVAAALREAAADGIDVVVSDIGLPDGSGLDLMRQIRQLRAAPARPAAPADSPAASPAAHPIAGIVLSGYGTDQDIARSRAAGFAEHLTKPVDLHVLADAIRRVAAQVSAH